LSAAIVIATACLAALAPAAASADSHADVVVASAGGGTWVLTVTNTSSVGAAGFDGAVPPAESFLAIEPAAHCGITMPDPTGWSCTEPLPPGGKQQVCFRASSNFSVADFNFDVDYNDGTIFYVTPTVGSAVSGCPLGSGGGGGPSGRRRCVVPIIKGRSLGAGRRRLRAKGCRLGRIRGPRNAAARVRSQSPAPGTVLARGGRVDVRTH
jgi:hypothetical protein